MMYVILIFGGMTLLNISGVIALTEYHPYFEDMKNPVPFVQIEDVESTGSLADFVRTELEEGEEAE